MFTILPNIGGSNTLVDPPRSNIGGVRTPVTPAALTPMTPCHCVWGGAASPLKNFLSLAWLANLLLYLKKSELIRRRVHRYNYNSA